MTQIKKINVEIVGTTPLLMHSPKAMLTPEQEIKTLSDKKYDDVIEAEKGAYRDDKSKELYVPSAAILGSLINAASYKKVGKLTLKPLIASAIRIKEEKIWLGTKTYEIDRRTVVLRKTKDRIVRCRPRIEEWKLKFEILYNPSLLPDSNIIKHCLEEAGERIGILDYRPQKLGSFGCFEVTKFEAE